MSERPLWPRLLAGLGGPAPGAGGRAGWTDFLERSPLVAALIFVLTVAAIVLVSSAGMTTLDAPLRLNQPATARVVAQASFGYESAEKTRAAREQYRNRVPPVYRLDPEPLRRFEAAAGLLLTQLAEFERAQPGDASAALLRFQPELARIAAAFNAPGPYHATPEDIAAVLGAGDARTRAALFDEGLRALRDIYAQGVADASLGGTGADGLVAFQIRRADDTSSSQPMQSLEDALAVLRGSLAGDQVPRAAAQAVFRLFRFGVTPNLVFDRLATAAREEAVSQALRPVTVRVVQGQTLVEPGDKVTPEVFELLNAHRNYLREHADAATQEGLTLLGRVLLVVAMVIASLIYIRIEDAETLRSNARLGLLALVVIANLALVRANYSLGGAEFFLRDEAWGSTLPYVAPTALAPLLVAILIDAGSGIFMALLVSIFTGVIYGNRLDLLVLTFLASLVAIYAGREARRRGAVVRAGGMGGLTMAAAAALLGLADQTPLETLGRQMIAGLGTGLLTGVAVVGLLPVLESLFKRTTDITLLELTDFNHPLLRRMQLEAPGTYHHSLVVAQLAENAAGAVGANPLVARVAALFHDVGKTERPAFFSENQRDRANPHAGIAPAESARLIRQHVADGVELAERHRLPRAVTDGIRQHHGTTLVRYFHQRALEATRTRGEPPPAEADFRYAGPRPQTREAALIMLADGVEAAARSLRHPGPEELQQTIQRVVAERIADGQLDEAPLTFDEVARIRSSFQFTLQNMLHARVAYPPATEPAGRGTPT
jgi:putative nucleotidyltransferase with HDIG domain